MSETPRYLVAGCTPWARRVFDKTLSKLPGMWQYAPDVDELNYLAHFHESRVQPYMGPPPPTYIFFLHWRWKVSAEIVNKYPCIGFHLGKLPHEGGGSPVQWRILEGQDPAILSMFRMTERVDEGNTIASVFVATHGAVEAVYARAMGAAAELIRDVVEGECDVDVVTKVSGATSTKTMRRKPEDSRIHINSALSDVYDWIRCVDAEGYPYAFLDHGNQRYTFRRAVLYDGRIEADVTITDLPE